MELLHQLAYLHAVQLTCWITAQTMIAVTSNAEALKLFMIPAMMIPHLLHTMLHLTAHLFHVTNIFQDLWYHNCELIAPQSHCRQEINSETIVIVRDYSPIQICLVNSIMRPAARKYCKHVPE